MKIISLGLILGLGIQFAEAWTSPSAAPPGGNVSGPITNGIASQYKTGRLGVNSITAPISALEVGGGGNAVIGGSIYTGGNLYTAGSVTSTYGALTLQGSKNSWSGINFKDAQGVNAGTLMMHPSYSGFFNAADNNWRWYVDNNGSSYQPGSMIIGGKASSTSTTTGDAGTTLATKDYVDSKAKSIKVASSEYEEMDHWNSGMRCKTVDYSSAGFTSPPHIIVAIADTGSWDPRGTPAYDADRSIARYWSVNSSNFYVCCGTSSHTSSDMDLGCAARWMAIGN